MKRLAILLLTLLLLTGCAPAEENPTQIVLSDGGITVDGGGETAAVYTSRDIVYYEDRDTYESGNPYGEGARWERHSQAEADAHLVVNITEPGVYRLRGTLSAGQIRVDLGEGAKKDPKASVELVLEGVDITCTVAPAVLFQNVYECDGDGTKKTATPQVSTASAGAKLTLSGENTLRGSHVARIYKDKEGKKKLWKQDAALYSYMSLQIDGEGSLELTADNEGIGSERHVTVNGGQIRIHAGNDGINANEDDISVITVNGGRLDILAGLGAEGDGIDSNGWLVINGGEVFTSAHPHTDSGLDTVLGAYIRGGTVAAFGAPMDWAAEDSSQGTLNLEFSEEQPGGGLLEVKNQGGEVVFTRRMPEDQHPYTAAVLSCPELKAGDAYTLWLNGQELTHVNMETTVTHVFPVP